MVTRWHLARAISSYICDLLTQYSQLVVVGDRAFAVAGPWLWYTLHIHMRQPDISLATFKQSLKTCLFKKAFL